MGEFSLSIKDLIYLITLVLSGGIAWGSVIRNNGIITDRMNKVEGILKEDVVKKEIFDEYKKQLDRIEKEGKEQLLRIEEKIDTQHDRCIQCFTRSESSKT